MLDYLDGDLDAAVSVYFEDHALSEDAGTSATPDDQLTAADMFRADGLFEVDHVALALARGRVLDVGAGAGVHALWLERRGYDVTAMETSALVRRVLDRRGLEKVIELDLFALASRREPEPPRFDTLLFMMNGLGIAGHMSQLEALLATSRRLVDAGGILVADTSDLTLSPDPDEPARIEQRLASGRTPGEALLRMTYGDLVGAPFPWLYVEPAALEPVATNTGWSTQIVFEDETGGYLVVLTAR
jgi:2-polyprenyl-3-methyl-5-hydroxy-6-metoxy-1,4-benzoquinol methylase